MSKLILSILIQIFRNSSCLKKRIKKKKSRKKLVKILEILKEIMILKSHKKQKMHWKK